MASIVGLSKKFCSCKNRCPNTSCFCSRIPPNGSSILLTTRLLLKIGYGSSSTTAELLIVRYTAEIVGWQNKTTLPEMKVNVVSRLLWTLQPQEGGLYHVGGGEKAQSTNLLYVWRMAELQIPFSVAELILTSTGAPHSPDRTTAGGGLYAAPRQTGLWHGSEQSESLWYIGTGNCRTNRLAAACRQRPLPPRGGSSLCVAAGTRSWQGAGRPPGALRRYLPRHQRFSSASQWLNHVPFALLRRSMATWWRAHQPSWLAGGVGSGAWLGAAGWSLLAAA